MEGKNPSSTYCAYIKNSLFFLYMTVKTHDLSQYGAEVVGMYSGGIRLARKAATAAAITTIRTGIQRPHCLCKRGASGVSESGARENCNFIPDLDTNTTKLPPHVPAREKPLSPAPISCWQPAKA